MLCKTQPDRDSIFGDTYCGVPNPQVPHKHPYPTRYHGMVGTVVQATLPYRVRPYVQPPFTTSAPPLQPWERHESVRGLGEDYTQRGGVLLDAVLGGVVGAAVAPKPAERLIWAAGGAILNGLAGTVGLAALSAGAMYARGRR